MNNALHILIYEKDTNLGTLVQEYLQLKGCRIDFFNDPEQAYNCFCNSRPAVCLIDNLSGTDTGLTLGKKIKNESPQTIVIFVSKQPLVKEVVDAFRLGADDFIRKPLSLEELYVRIKAIRWRLTGIKDKEIAYYQIGNFLFDTQHRTLTLHQQSYKLTTKESCLLHLLCEHANEIVDRGYALRSVWRNDDSYNARSMDVYISKLRKYLAKDTGVYIVNIHGKGYKLVTRQDVG